MMNLIRWMSSVYVQYLEHRVDCIMRALYPDLDDRAMVYAMLAAEAEEAYLFGHGETLESLAVIPNDEDGYHFEATTTEEVEH